MYLNQITVIVNLSVQYVFYSHNNVHQIPLSMLYVNIAVFDDSFLNTHHSF